MLKCPAKISMCTSGLVGNDNCYRDNLWSNFALSKFTEDKAVRCNIKDINI